MDCAILLGAVAGQDGIDDRGFAAPHARQIPNYAEKLKELGTSGTIGGLKIGIISESLAGPVLDPRVKMCFLAAADQLRNQGADIEEVSIPIHKKGTAIWTGVSKVAGYLSKLHGSVGRRSYNMIDLNSMMHPITQANWDGAYVS
jgi:amidase